MKYRIAGLAAIALLAVGVVDSSNAQAGNVVSLVSKVNDGCQAVGSGKLRYTKNAAGKAAANCKVAFEAGNANPGDEYTCFYQTSSGNVNAGTLVLAADEHGDLSGKVRTINPEFEPIPGSLVVIFDQFFTPIFQGEFESAPAPAGHVKLGSTMDDSCLDQGVAKITYTKNAAGKRVVTCKVQIDAGNASAGDDYVCVIIQAQGATLLVGNLELVADEDGDLSGKVRTVITDNLGDPAAGDLVVVFDEFFNVDFEGVLEAK